MKFIYAPILLLFLVLSACASTEPVIVGAEGIKVETIEFEGVTRFSKGQLLGVMYSKEDSWVPLSPDAPFDDALATSDIARILEFYRAHGYFEARVIELKSEVVDSKAQLKFVVDEGPAATVGELKVQWMTEVPEDVQERAEEQILLKRDEVFEVGRYNQTLGAIRQSLQNDGYPHAETTGGVQVRLTHSDALVEIRIIPGKSAVIGAIDIEGLVDVPEHLVMAELEFAQGEAFSPARLRQMETALRSMRVFRWVSAQPATEVADGKVGVQVQVSEADPHELKIGAELSVDTVRWQEQARLNYTYTNLFGNLTRLDLGAIAGWAQLPNPWDTDLNGPVASINPKITKKGLLERHLLWSVNPTVALDLQEGYQYFTVKNRFGVSRWFAGRFLVGIGQNTDYVDFFNLDPELDQRTALLGRDFRDPYLLSSLEAHAAAYFVDQITSPTDGVIIEATYNFASEVVLSDFDFHKALFGIRGYLKPFERLQLASRARAGIIYPFGPDGSVPFNQRFYLGGATSVRGWGSRRLSPRIEECEGEAESQSCSVIPIGGYSMLQGNFEARIKLVEQLSLVGFFDVGDVRPDALDFNLAELNYSAGPGLRANTPLGVVRLDLGFRLNDTGRFEGEQMWGIYFGLGQAL